MAKWEISDTDFDKQFEKATNMAKENDLKEPRAIKVKFDKKTKRIVVDLNNGATFIFPVNIIQGLTNATDEEIAQVKITPSKSGLTWDNLDVHFTLMSIMVGWFGNKKWMSELGKIGGSVKSDQKTISSRENGKKGGRPIKIRDEINTGS